MSVGGVTLAKQKNDLFISSSLVSKERGWSLMGAKMLGRTNCEGYSSQNGQRISGEELT